MTLQEERQDLLALSDERKWKLIQNDVTRRVRLPPDYFVTQLNRHLDPENRSKKVNKKMLAGLGAFVPPNRKQSSTSCVLTTYLNFAAYNDSGTTDPSSQVLEKLESALQTNREVITTGRLPFGSSQWHSLTGATLRVTV